MIDWSALETMVNDLDQIWYETESGRNRSRELHAIHELRRCTLAAPPALCFFAGRMVEVSVAREWARFQISCGSPSETFQLFLDEQINHLQQLGHLDELSTACIHEIRKWGNKVRHHATFPSESDAAFALAMLKVALPWMAGDDRGPAQEICDSHHVTLLDQEVRWLLNATTLANPAIGMPDLLCHAPNLLDAINRVGSKGFPTQLTNWVTQQCIDAKRLDLAGELIAAFLQNGDADAPLLRPDRDSHFRVSHFARLVALRLSRMGSPLVAVDLLTSLAKQAGYLADDGAPVPLRSAYSHAYAETLGILAGAHKTLWMNQHEPTDLARVARLYQHALRAEPWNSYLAINAAACSAWSGDLASTRAFSAELLRRLPAPRHTVHEDKGVTSLWNLLTRAEALLLGGQHTPAIEGYRRANHLFGATHGGALERAYLQVCVHAQHNVLDGATQAAVAAALGFPSRASSSG
jgi:hypothetical protein